MKDHSGRSFHHFAYEIFTNGRSNDKLVTNKGHGGWLPFVDRCALTNTDGSMTLGFTSVVVGTLAQVRGYLLT